MPASHSVAWQGNLGQQNIQVNQSCKKEREKRQINNIFFYPLLYPDSGIKKVLSGESEAGTLL